MVKCLGILKKIHFFLNSNKIIKGVGINYSASHFTGPQANNTQYHDAEEPALSLATPSFEVPRGIIRTMHNCYA